MKGGNDEEVEAEKSRTDDLVEDGRQPGTLGEAMAADGAATDDDGAAPELGLVSSGALSALLTRAIREERVAKTSDFAAFEVRRSPQGQQEGMEGEAWGLEETSSGTLQQGRQFHR